MTIVIKKVISKFILILQLYLLKHLSGKTSLIFIDIGANGFKKPILKNAFNKFKLIGFDPDPRINIFNDKSFKIEFYPYALSCDNSKKKLYLTQKPHCSSLKEPLEVDDLRYKIKKVIDVECRTLDNLNIYANIMKIDAQGSELDILKHAKNTLKNIDIVEVEAWFTSKYKKQPKIDQIHKLMSKNGFNFIGFSSLYYCDAKERTKNGIEFGDMLFVKNKLKISNKKFVISYLITKYHDLSIEHLDLIKGYKFMDRFILKLIIFIGKFKRSSPLIN